MSDHPLVYIVLLNWNGWRDTLDCLHSLESLQSTNHRVVVVDNASTDESVDILQRTYPSIELLQAPGNHGFAAGNNIGILHGLKQKASYIWVLNNDTIVDRRALASLVEMAESDRKVGAVSSVVLYYSQPQKIQLWGGGRVNLWLGTTGLLTSTATEPLHYLGGVSLLLRRELFEDIGLLDERYFMYWEDVDLGMRARASGWKLAVAPGSRIWHKGSQSTGGEGSTKTYAFYSATSLRFFRHHAPFPLVPLSIRLLGGTVKWFLKRDWERLRILWRAYFREIKE